MKQKLLSRIKYQTAPVLIGSVGGLVFTYAILGYVFPGQFLVTGFLIGISLMVEI